MPASLGFMVEANFGIMGSQSLLYVRLSKVSLVLITVTNGIVTKIQTAIQGVRMNSSLILRLS